MPPKIRYTKKDILAAALELTRQKGIEGINARSLAIKMGCSTQPLFREFNSIGEIRAEVSKIAREIYNSYLADSRHMDIPEFKGMGLAYIAFARDEPELFKLIFMRDRQADGTLNSDDDPNSDMIKETVMRKSGLPPDKANLLHLNSWIYAHGLAVMLATRYIDISDAQLSDMLSFEYSALLAKIRGE